MKKLTLGARIKSLLPTLSISLPAVITGILIFSETNLIDPLTSLLSRKEDENKKEEEDTEGDGEKGTKEKEKSEKKGGGKGGKGAGSENSLDSKGDKDSGKGKESIDRGTDQNNGGSDLDVQENGKPNSQGENEGDNNSDLLSADQEGINKVPDVSTGKGDGENEAKAEEGTNLISPGETKGSAEEREPAKGTRRVRKIAPAFEVFFGGSIEEEW